MATPGAMARAFQLSVLLCSLAVGGCDSPKSTNPSASSSAAVPRAAESAPIVGSTQASSKRWLEAPEIVRSVSGRGQNAVQVLFSKRACRVLDDGATLRARCAARAVGGLATSAYDDGLAWIDERGLALENGARLDARGLALQLRGSVLEDGTKVLLYRSDPNWWLIQDGAKEPRLLPWKTGSSVVLFWEHVLAADSDRSVQAVSALDSAPPARMTVPTADDLDAAQSCRSATTLFVHVPARTTRPGTLLVRTSKRWMALDGAGPAGEISCEGSIARVAAIRDLPSTRKLTLTTCGEKECAASEAIAPPNTQAAVALGDLMLVAAADVDAEDSRVVELRLAALDALSSAKPLELPAGLVDGRIKSLKTVQVGKRALVLALTDQGVFGMQVDRTGKVRALPAT